MYNEHITSVIRNSGKRVLGMLIYFVNSCTQLGKNINVQFSQYCASIDTKIACKKNLELMYEKIFSVLKNTDTDIFYSLFHKTYDRKQCNIGVFIEINFGVDGKNIIERNPLGQCGQDDDIVDFYRRQSCYNCQITSKIQFVLRVFVSFLLFWDASMKINK